MIRHVILYGEMAERFGREFRLAVTSAADLARALGAQLPGFKKYLVENRFVIVCGKSLQDGYNLSDLEVDLNFSKGDFHVMPVIEGSGGGGGGGGQSGGDQRRMGMFKIIAGLIIAAVAWWALPAAGVSATMTKTLTMFGLGLALKGVSMMLSKPPKKPEEPEDESSFLFNGATNTAEQGGPVPLVYGETITGSVVISVGISAEDIPLPPGASRRDTSSGSK